MATAFPITPAVTLATETWRAVAGYEHYQVSSRGRVRSFAQKSPRIMRPGIASNGYLTVSLWRSNKGRTHCVHNLVADAFLGAGAGLDVDHIDRDRTNNSLQNLRRVTAQENRGEPNAKQFTLSAPCGAVIRGENLSKFCRQHGLNRASMGGVIQGRMRQHKGWSSV